MRIGQVSQTLQQNAAASQQLSSTSEEMSTQAIRLQESMTYFTLDNYSSKKTDQPASKKLSISSSKSKSSDRRPVAVSDDELDKSFVRYG